MVSCQKQIRSADVGIHVQPYFFHSSFVTGGNEYHLAVLDLWLQIHYQLKIKYLTY
jgi:hypothetical protein